MGRPSSCLRLWLAVLLSAGAVALPAQETTVKRRVLVIPRVQHPPQLEDFLEMRPADGVATRLAKVEGFLQRAPSDGASASQRTEAYLGYDDRNLYVIFVCFDSEPEKIRARMVPREQLFSDQGALDDIVSVDLDTFLDQRRAYVFTANPLGIQADTIWTEGQGHDSSFDTVWQSRGRLTPQGYVVWMAIPFKSLRFPATPDQIWGILLNRDIPRNNEETYWPHYSSRIEGRLNQTADLQGLAAISPGRNLQFIPYGAFRSFRALDTRDPAQPRFVRDRDDPDVGLDAKLVFQDSLVLDLALNPDFSQVESDEPQVTVNQRFEVFFPEKRPFFIENASFFETPINLLFTRRIGDPQFGVRLTGKLGRYAVGALLADDQAPGRSVPDTHAFMGARARFAVLRLNRDLFRQSTLGVIYTDRAFEGSSNRVGGVDGRFKLGENWVARFQAVASDTRCFPLGAFSGLASGVRQRLDGCFPADSGDLAGPAYDAQVTRSGRQLDYNLEYNDRSRGFRTVPGFLLRPDIRRFGQQVQYRFRPEGPALVSWGPYSNTELVHDHSGLRLDLTQDTQLNFELVGQTHIGLFYNWDRERLRPVDFPVLPANRDFRRNRKGFAFTTSYFPQLTAAANYSWGTRINFVPPAGQELLLADVTALNFLLTVRPLARLRIDNTYILARLTDRASNAGIMNNHIIRSKWNWQFTRELSLRVILQYDAVLANPALTVLRTTKNFNADFLLTYLVHPGTALYIGYNSNLQNLDPSLAQVNPPTDLSLLRPRNSFINDGKQFFIKFSYLLRF